MSSFGRNRDRYALIERPGTAPDTAESDKRGYRGGDDYAAFLQDYMKGKSEDQYMTSYKVSQKPQQKDDSVPELAKRLERDKDVYSKRLRKIEDLMWQHKQHERELKRSEGDIIKDQRQVRQSLRQFEQAIARKRMAEEKRLDTDMQKYDKLQKDYIKTRTNVTKERSETKRSQEMQNKSKGRKFNVDIAKMEKDYKLKHDALEQKQKELERISRDYEAKLRAKETEQLQLKTEMAELAVAMNMTAHKASEHDHQVDKEKSQTSRQNIDSDLNNEAELRQQLAKSSVDVKLSDNSRRKTNAELTLTRAHLAMKQREGGRQLQDVHSNLETNRVVQRRLNDAAFDAEQDLKGREIENKIELVNAKRAALQAEYMRSRQEKEEATDRIMRDRHQRRDLDQQQIVLQDQLKHFQKSVRRNEEREVDLFNKVREAEYQRQKQDQHVRDLKRQLDKLKRDNAARIKREMVECEKKEKELITDILKEESQLAKVHNQREYSYYTLQNHRVATSEDRYLLTKHDSQYQRLARIAQKSDAS